jgi:hypothetical protein
MKVKPITRGEHHMYSNGGGLEADIREKALDTGWQSNRNTNLFKNGKCFVSCLCPKCGSYHRVYMLWSGRGMPRKYCANCKPVVSGYDEGVISEASISTAGHSRKGGRCYESE